MFYYNPVKQLVKNLQHNLQQQKIKQEKISQATCDKVLPSLHPQEE